MSRNARNPGVRSFHVSRLFLAFVLMAPISLAASGGDSGVKGIVKDELGAAIENATVFLSTTSIRSTRTNRNGEFSLAVTADGFYDLFVSAPGFSPTCAKLRVQEHHWLVFIPTLKVDPLTVKLHGDTFDTKPRSQKH